MFRSVWPLATALLVLSGCSSGTATVEPPVVETVGAAHAGHHMQLSNIVPDEQGRLLYGMEHDVDPAMIAQLQTREVFAGYTAEQLTRVMGLMGSNYAWPVSAASQRGDQGVLILAHGFGEHGDALLRTQLQPLGLQYPTSLAIGMSMMTSAHIQLALDGLTAAGAQEIAVVPVVSTRHNSLMRQWDYIFGRDDEPAYGQVPRVSSSADLLVTQPLDDHPLVAEIVVDYAAEISVDPPDEEVIIVGHGPVDPVDNLAQLRLMENLADAVRANSNYAAVHVVSLQDDAASDVRMARARELRELVARANGQGRDVLVVTNLLGTRIVQKSLRGYLRGLNFRFNDKGLIQHENFIRWINLSVKETLLDAD